MEHALMIRDSDKLSPHPSPMPQRPHTSNLFEIFKVPLCVGDPWGQLSQQRT